MLNVVYRAIVFEQKSLRQQNGEPPTVIQWSYCYNQANFNIVNSS